MLLPLATYTLRVSFLTHLISNVTTISVLDRVRLSQELSTALQERCDYLDRCLEAQTWDEFFR